MPPVVTDIGSTENPGGTATVSSLAVADKTAVFTDPNLTWLLAGWESKCVPLIATTVASGPFNGEIEVICGAGLANPDTITIDPLKGLIPLLPAKSCFTVITSASGSYSIRLP